jgi:hypothetical protein
MTNAKPRLALALGILCISIFRYWLKLSLLLVNFSILDAIAVAVIALCANHQKFQLPQKKNI